MHKQYTYTLTRQESQISNEEAKQLLVCAVIVFPGELDVFESYDKDFNHRLFTLDIPKDWTPHNKEEEELLEYARENMPDNLRFGQR